MGRTPWWETSGAGAQTNAWGRMGIPGLSFWHAQGSGIQAVPNSLVSRESFEISPSAERAAAAPHAPCPPAPGITPVRDRVEKTPSNPSQPISTLTPGVLTHGAPAMRQRTSYQAVFFNFHTQKAAPRQPGEPYPSWILFQREKNGRNVLLFPCCIFFGRSCLQSTAPFLARVAGGLRAARVLGGCRGQALPAGMGASRVLDLATGSAFAQLSSPRSQPLHPCAGLSPSRPTGADVGPDRKHLQALSPQRCFPPSASSCLALPTWLPASSWALIPVLPALPTITISMGTFLKSTAMHPLGSASLPLPCALYSKPSRCLSPVTGDVSL